MTFKQPMAQLLAGVSVIALVGTGYSALQAQGAAPAAAAGGGRGGAGAANAGVFAAADLNKDGVLTRGELLTALENWYAAADTSKSGAITEAQLLTALDGVLPAPAPAAGRGNANPCAAQGSHTPCPDQVAAMMAALPDKAYAKPAKPRKLLIYAIDNNSPSHGFVHSSIALQAATMKAMGDKLGTWSTTLTYDPADINTANLAQYDAILLDSTTGCFLDQPGDKAATDARRAALLAFVRGGKGLAGIHAATDSYHSACPNDPGAAARGGGGGRNAAAAAPGAGAPAAGRGGGAGTQLAGEIMAQADKNGDQKLSLIEMTALGNQWFDKMDTDKTGRISQADFPARFALAQPQPAAAAGGRGGRGAGAGAAGGADAANPVARGSVHPVGTWPEFNQMIGGFFKFHWSGLHATVKIDDPKSPLTQMFGGKEFEIVDETYTYAQDSFSRKNVHVLTSVDYDKMPQNVKDQEPAATARTDGDYALSWIRAEGKGRVFYEAHGHSESIYAIKIMNEHYLAGLQYVLGDLKADDKPSVK